MYRFRYVSMHLVFALQVAKVGQDSFGDDQIRNLKEQSIDCTQVSDLDSVEAIPL
jgi:sugar/nucleoside kinase (ribokinase family)